MNLQILDLVVSTIGILLLAALWYLFWRPLAAAHFQQDMFDARDVLFDLVADGGTSLKFQSPVYCGTRRDINAMIRSGHKISLAAALLAGVFIPRARQLHSERNSALLASLTEEERNVIKLIDRKQQMGVLCFLVSTSTLMWFLIIVVGLLVSIIGVAQMLKDGVKALNHGVKTVHTVCSEAMMTIRSIFRDHLFKPAVALVEFQLGQKYLSGRI